MSWGPISTTSSIVSGCDEMVGTRAGSAGARRFLIAPGMTFSAPRPIASTMPTLRCTRPVTRCEKAIAGRSERFHLRL